MRIKIYIIINEVLIVCFYGENVMLTLQVHFKELMLKTLKTTKRNEVQPVNSVLQCQFNKP